MKTWHQPPATNSNKQPPFLRVHMRSLLPLPQIARSPLGLGFLPAPLASVHSHIALLHTAKPPASSPHSAYLTNYLPTHTKSYEIHELRNHFSKVTWLAQWRPCSLAYLLRCHAKAVSCWLSKCSPPCSFHQNPLSLRRQTLSTTDNF